MFSVISGDWLGGGGPELRGGGGRGVSLFYFKATLIQ